MSTRIQSLVTGGAGFIGSHLSKELINKKHEVFCIDNLVTGRKENIQDLIKNPQFHFIQQDITSPTLFTVVKKIPNLRFVYHLASPASPPKYKKFSIETLLVNSLGTYQLLEIAKNHKATFLLASTSEVYGNPLQHPQKESYYGNVNPIGVRACYDEGKRFAEAISMEYFRKFHLDVKIIRIFNTYGPNMDKHDGRVISNFINQAIAGISLTMHGDGQQTRSFCYVSDMVRGIITAMESQAARGIVINLGYPKEHTIRDIADTILKLTQSKSKIISGKLQEDDPERRKPDILRAQKLLNWSPVVSLEEGLQKTIEYFQNV